MAPPPPWTRTLSAACDEATLAVQLYNETLQVRAFEAFVVHMHIAWLYLLHARFMRDGTEFRYRDRLNPRRFVYVDGDFKRFELAECVKTRWKDPNDAARRNIEFFIALRNKIEHRYAKSDRSLGLAVSGHAQALLLNFEDELTATFGQEYSLADVLRFPIFIGTFTTEGEQTLRQLRGRLPAGLQKFIAEYHAGLTDDIARDCRFELKMRVILEQVQHGPDALSIQFTHWKDLSDEERALVEQLGKRGQSVTKEKVRSIVGAGLLLPEEARLQVRAAIPYEFNTNHFLRARRIKKIRPDKGDVNPERTIERYCVYIEPTRTYAYTDEWVRYLIKKCSTDVGFKEATGRDPLPRSDY